MSGKRQPRQRNDDFLMGEAPGAPSSVALVPAARSNERLLLIPQEVNGAEGGGGVPWFVWALLIAGVGYLILKQEKII